MAEVNPTAKGLPGGSKDKSSDDEPPKSDSLNKWKPGTRPRSQRRSNGLGDLIYRPRNRAKEDQKSRRLRRQLKRRVRELEYANRTKMALVKKPKQRHPGESSLHLHFGEMSIAQPSTSRDMTGSSARTSVTPAPTSISPFANQANEENRLNMIPSEFDNIIIEIDEDTHT